MRCVRCRSFATIKYGKRNDRQCFFCKSCHYQFTDNKKFNEKEKVAAFSLFCLGISYRKIGTLLLYSPSTIYYWISSFQKLYSDEKDIKLMTIADITDLISTRLDFASSKQLLGFKNLIKENIQCEIIALINSSLNRLTFEYDLKLPETLTNE